MTTISYDIIPGFFASSGSGTTEWFTVPTSHEYIGEVKISHRGSSGSGTTSYSLAWISSSGSAPTSADYLSPLNVELFEGDAHTYTIELGAGKGLSVISGTAPITFNFSGLDKDNS